jgi:excinuclease ABC subunit A
MAEYLTIRGASEHNLRGINLDLPKNALIVFTGVSGSGKSSLAFDTLFAEGQRRYLESLSPYARQFLQQLPRPKVRRLEGLCPAIAISQAARSHNPRSTVATITEIYDHLRVLYAALGVPHCPRCGREIGAQSRELIIERLMAFPKGSRVMILAPLERARRGEFGERFQELRRKGFARVRVDGEVFDLLHPPHLDRHRRHDVDLVIDRVTIEPGARARVAEAVDVALQMSGGDVLAVPEQGEELLLSQRLACPECGLSVPELTHASFSFNSPRGMCPECEGLGVTRTFDPDKLVEHPERSILDGAIPLLPSLRDRRRRHWFEGAARHYGFDLRTPWRDLQPEHQQVLLYGSGGQLIDFHFRHWRGWEWRHRDPFAGVVAWLTERYKRARSPALLRRYEAYMRMGPCPACRGRRLRPESLAVTIAGRSIADVVAMTVEEAATWFANLQLTPTQQHIAEDALKEIRERLEFLKRVGLGYLTLDRTAPTLAGGEAQRLRLASQVGAGLSDCLYVLDEPSIGLHPRDQGQLLATLRALRDRDNTVVVVEHDEQTILAADWVVDFGPGPGHRGGRIVAQGTPAQLKRQPQSLTGQYLARRASIPVPQQRRVPTGRWLVLRGARHNNLKNLAVRFPLGLLICVTGVSGSGKSSLVTDTLYPALARTLHGAQVEPGAYEALEGVEHLDKVVLVDQDPIGRTPRSNPATYVGVFDHIRAWFAQLPESRARGYRPGRFSFNRPEGRCPACDGHGARKVESDFLAEVWVPCETCGGTRFNRATLTITYRGKNIAQVLDMEVEEAWEHFRQVPRVRAMLDIMRAVGLGYIKLGQPAPTLSGGEAQRVKLAEQLARPRTGRGLYILDEPTTGLHADDVRQLIAVLQRFVDEGHTVIVVEHNPEVIKCADWVIDLGPEGGAAGGYLVAEGPPEHIAQIPHSHTGRVLRQVLAGKPVAPPPGPRRRLGKRRQTHILVRGAREHNLRNLDARIPRNRVTVFSGVSGSGKTSLALDTIYAEGQRRFVETLSPYARQFVSQMPKPKVRRITGLSPAIAVDQRGVPYNPRATVGTMTQIYDYMRVLFARLATSYCPDCGAEIGAQTADAIVDRVLREFADDLVLVLAPLRLRRQEDYPEVFARLERQGWRRVRVDGEVLGLPVREEISRRRRRQVELVVDRLPVQTGRRARLVEAVEAATKVSEGEVVVVSVASGRQLRLSLMYGCPQCGRVLEPLTARHFSFNHPEGWCPVCEGLGVQPGIDPEALLTDDRRSLRAGAVALWGPVEESTPWGTLLSCLAARLGFSLDTPLGELTPAQRRALLEGSPDWVRLPDGTRVRWRGLATALEEAARLSPEFRQRYARGLTELPCPACQGGRLRPEAAAARFAGRTLVELALEPLGQVERWFAALRLSAADRQVAGEVLSEIRSRLRFLVDLGLDYLTLHRPGPSLSSGEAQRVRLAGQLGSNLTGVLYVMDEPTIGIHPRDTNLMLRVVERLRDQGNTVIVVEHDPQTLRRADYILDFGPGAGPQGGAIVAQGCPERLARARRSLTGRYLAGQLPVPVPEQRRLTAAGDPAAGASAPDPKGRPMLIVEGCREHNLRDITVHIPLECLVCVTGPSGSGKSTLVQDIIYAELAYRLQGAATTPGKHRALHGWQQLRAVALLDQSPIGHSPRSNPATYVGLFDHLRAFFANLPEARVRGFTPEHFSFNRPGGRCEECEGLGARLVQMHFLPDVWVTCEACGGRRYKPEILAVRYRGRNIADVLEMSIGAAAELFAAFPRLSRPLRLLCDMGLDYLPLGQAAPSLSGGEAQRLKIARELLKGRRQGTLYLLDEPTTGLHPADLLKLLRVLNRLVDDGNTVVVIEHNVDFIKNADWVIDLGPGGGDQGGWLMAEGTPEQVAQQLDAPTAPFLAEALRTAPRVPLAELTLRRPRAGAPLASPHPLPQTPWEENPRQWHLQQRLHGEQKAYWAPQVLQEIDTVLLALGARADWAHREHIYYYPPSGPPWWAYVRTSGRYYVELVLRTPKGLFDEEDLQRRLQLPAWSELPDLPLWSDTPRVRVQTSPRRYDRVLIRLVQPEEVKAALRATLAEAWQAAGGALPQAAAEEAAS